MPAAADIETRLSEYRQAESRILRAQEYSISDGGVQHRHRRAELEHIQAQIEKLEKQLEQARATESGGRRVVFIRPGA